jgi:hypothetical protein
MATQAFRKLNISDERLARIEQAREILAEYDTKLTARQLYYQFVARGLIENTPRSYQNLTILITDARYAGLIDWDAIEDRGREPALPLEFRDLDHRVESALANYRLPRWADQPAYAELWVEKQALAGVLAPLAREFHVPLMVNKGYSSASAMHESAMRMREAQGLTGEWYTDWSERVDNDPDLADAAENAPELHKRLQRAYVDEFIANTKPVTVFYLGDHDPSGEDMVRDITERLKEFGVKRLTVEKLALTMAQIRRFNPPPNPAKLSDSRAKAYIAKYGQQSWEVDALPPRELQRIIRGALASVIDVDKMNAVKAREEADKETLRRAFERAKKGGGK